jgi:FemAB-related protein (PEP-CTERM system-associated)
MTTAGLRLVRALPLVVRDDVGSDVADAFVRQHPAGTSYHRRAWLDVIRSAFGHRSIYLAAESGGELAGVLPIVFFKSALFGRFAVSMPFLNYGGALATTPDVARNLLTRAIEETRKAGAAHLELRHVRQHFPDLPAKRHKVAMELKLAETVDAQWLALDRKLRNQVRKAEKSSLTAVHGGIELVDSFYQVFARNMRDLGTPVYGRTFFEAILRTFPHESRIVVVQLNGRPVAASILHWFGSRIEVPWASALREFNPLCANVLLYWEMLKFAIDRGLTTFDFGRSTPGEGTFHFKKQWGAEASELVWEYWMADGKAMPQLNPKNPKFDLAIRAWQRLPLPIATALGPHVVRNIP